MTLTHLPTQYLGHPFIHHDTLDSTNSAAQQLIQNHQAKHGAVIHANLQTAGRGQQHSFWESAQAQNLTFSAIVFPDLPVEQQHWLTVAVSLALCDTLNNRLPVAVSIKWPNDILCESSKMCGILIQNNLKGSMIHSTVIGIGLNVNQDQFACERATSMALLTGQYYDREAVLRELLARLEGRLAAIACSSRRVQLKKEYLERMFWRGEVHRFTDAQSDFYGTIIGIDDQGRLAVEVDQRIRYYDNKQLTYCF